MAQLSSHLLRGENHMQLPDHILGKGAVQALQERVKAPVLVIGTDRFTRAHLAGVACFNFIAASHLSNILTNQLKVKDTNDLFRNVAPSALALPGLGVFSLATLGAVFEVKLGKTLTDYVDHHRAENEAVVTFDTIKAHNQDSKAERKAKKDERKRKRTRRAIAHEHRVQRFVERHPKTRGNGVTNGNGTNKGA
jgi:hypothetical protein